MANVFIYLLQICSSPLYPSLFFLSLSLSHTRTHTHGRAHTRTQTLFQQFSAQRLSACYTAALAQSDWLKVAQSTLSSNHMLFLKPCTYAQGHKLLISLTSDQLSPCTLRHLSFHKIHSNPISVKARAGTVTRQGEWGTARSVCTHRKTHLKDTDRHTPTHTYPQKEHTNKHLYKRTQYKQMIYKSYYYM